MRKEYYKLVRDRIPETIRQSGGKPEIKVLSEAEYRIALRNKLREEAEEVQESDDASLLEELADILEVVESLRKSYNISDEQIQLKVDEKRAQRGGFEQKIMLLWTE
ncbi:MULTISPECIES: nucleoside triphosphate pyrophosphohydrolase [Arthrospira]|jgi:predicted house-cleaning noncanonical NTP pyrophosphatase (MazG superfamily)|uniref:MazG nucleotide pyrophosphohydrolase n=1 Tax=Limnospira platensis NIES-46 TaxID=1236695 RepID=A0A5M3TEJ9_LIMPL|nr:nucleoside triphosphate pyrophosphohydrolase [Arthrospira platensis]AMW30798.1 nucleotide pyrophosphohydrolase [Arthrospira platensis YZ]KDR55186.1 nucleotide pyrophosphohydrolase [Arthrospira platensis str. Paraca]MBD2671858.1 nucleoside triphosphate pyrophosphohydrolase [Arthrospira platensis FACHB-439]MBD2712832.1 nucleoside triphosphate pyrophosphohydrolase [Arthrospira platensis FACHB-835]MDF2208127.1 nucleoside triphosphate pyrophosphohydrolase [Arthrospira platensis NCB002]MDT918548